MHIDISLTIIVESVLVIRVRWNIKAMMIPLTPIMSEKADKERADEHMPIETHLRFSRHKYKNFQLLGVILTLRMEWTNKRWKRKGKAN